MSVKIVDLGFCTYSESLKIQDKYHSAAVRGEDDTFLFVEHDPVYTLGKNAVDENILDEYPRDVKIYNIDRGGDVTYHGPGQLVGYPIINIKNRKMSIGRYVHTLESIILDSLKYYNIEAQIRDKLIGVWVGLEKIAAIGVRVIEGVTKHGFAINVNTDLSYFNGIIPCGIEDCQVTSIEKLLGKKVELSEVQMVIVREFKKHFI